MQLRGICFILLRRIMGNGFERERDWNMQRIASDHRFKTALLVLMAAAVLAITVTRAAITEITYDEAFTYMAYAQEIRFDEFDTFRYVYNESVANNHWLNTVAIAAAERLIGVSYCEFAIRLPNLVFFAIYCAFVCIGYQKRMFSFLCASFLLLNYYLDEFYGLARGYAMAQTCVFAAAWFYLRWKNSRYRGHGNLIGCALSLMIGTYANTVVFLVFPAFGILWLWRLISEGQFWPFLKKWAWFVVLFVFSSFFMLKYHFKVSAPGLTLFTGDDDFYHSVIQSYIAMITTAPVLGSVLLILLCMISAAAAAILRKDVLRCDLMISLVIFIVTNILMNAVTKRGYITDRVTLPFYGYIVLSIFELWSAAWKKWNPAWLNGGRKRKLHLAASVLIVLLLGIRFAQQLSFTKTIDWAHNYGDRDRLLGGFIVTGEFPKIEKDGPNDQFYRVKYQYIANTYS